MTCRLCDKEKDLKNSHIIPEFVYKQLYDHKGRFHVLSTQEKRPRPLEQKGIREKLLCGDCEQQLSKYEKYASEIIMGGEAFTAQQVGNLLQLSDIDYHKFKLFLLSILWRSSISKHSLFSRVQLGPHEDKIKQLIRNDDPGKQLQYIVIYWYGIPRVIMRHLNCPRCPHLHEYGDCLQAPPAISKWLVKKRKTTPYSANEKFLFYTIAILIPTYPIFWLLSNLILLSIFLIAASMWFLGQFLYFCKRCRVKECPFNRSILR